MDQPGNVVELREVCKHYGDDPVVRNVTLSVRRGECLALLGHNGAGKTTLIKLILGLTRPSRGHIIVHGHDTAVVSPSQWRHELGFLPENVAFHDTMTGRELLRLYGRLKRRTRRECEQLLARVGLAEAASNRVSTYSKGMRQRLGLAQALLGNPAMLLLDEPTTGLDPGLRVEFYQLIKERLEAGATALICSHSLSEIERSADRFAILKRGQIVASGTLEQLRRQAGLPTRIRVSVEPGATRQVVNHIDDSVHFDQINNQTIDLSCLEADKLRVLQQITSLRGPVRDVDISPASLEHIYAFFTHEERTV